MQTVTIKINNPHALNLLQELEAMKMIEVITKKIGPPKKAKLPLSERLAGSISADQAKNMRLELIQMRDEWERNI